MLNLKIISICLFAVTIRAGGRGESYVNSHLYSYGGHQVDAGHKNHDYFAYPKYNFEYGVKDPHTGDYKMQYEERDGDVVRGYYSLREPDGTIRTVHYTADKVNGFNAHVVRQGYAEHPPHPGH